ncbi:hypothetical protein ACFQ2T_10695 [Methylophilus flavus]|uniref:DUF1311 domain-containing protein n=1 Tax=Methylophilus flavus TaxID=640084 RepID=A0ABW3PBK3_9PROT
MYLRYIVSIVCLCLASTTVSATVLTKKEISKLEESITFEYRQGLKVCDTLNWNESDVCTAQANSKRDIDRAELKANVNPTAKSRYAALMAHMNGNHEVAIIKCDGVALSDKVACLSDAEGAKEIALQKANNFWGKLIQ